MDLHEPFGASSVHGVQQTTRTTEGDHPARELGTRLGMDGSITANSWASGAEGDHVVNGVRKMRNVFSRWLDSV